MAAENDPYNSMLNSEKNDIRPGFLGGNGDNEGKGKAAGALSAAEKAAGTIASAKTGKAPSGDGGAMPGGANGGSKNPAQEGLKSEAEKSNAEKAEGKESEPKGLYNKDNSKADEDDEPKLKMSKGMKTGLKAAAAPLVLVLVAIGAIILIIIGVPIMMIGAIDYNLLKVLGFEETVATLEEVGEYVTAEFMKDGYFPDEYASDLASNGIDVGQVTANGDFVRTNVYIANIEERNDLVAAASGFSYISDNEGELAMLYNGNIIHAGDFVKEVESDPTLYAVYSSSTDISAKYYYSEDVEEVYGEMGLSRGNFNNWETTGNYEEDEAKYNEILKNILNSGSDLAVGGAHKDTQRPDGIAITYDEEDADGGTYAEDVSGVNSGVVTEDVSLKTQNYIIKWLPHEEIINGKKQIVWGPEYSDNATQRASELLNTAVSSGEPYLASNAFIAIEEPIQRARVDGDGPVNQVMNTLTRGTEVSYQNVETGGTETKKLAILETKNFRAVVSDSDYSKEEAANFGRDRILKTTGQGDETIIKKTTVATPGKVDSSSVVRNGKNKSRHADQDIVSRANENIELSQANNNSSSFQSVIGGNRAIEGGSFLSNTINMQVIGAMPSNAAKIAEYHTEAEKAMARRAEAERATKSPFDASSPYTFLGSITHNIGMAAIRNYSSGTALSAIGSVSDFAGKAVANLVGSVTASGGDNEYTTMSGLGCETVNAVGVEGDLYCTSHNTPSTKYINYDMGAFKGSEIGGEIGDDGQPVEGSGLYEFVSYGMKRYASVGVKNAEVCQRYRDDHPDYTPPGQGIWDRVVNFFKNMLGTYDVCDVGVDDDDNDIDTEVRAIYTGEKYAFSGENSSRNELYSAYVMYDKVKSLLTGEQGAVSKMWDKYQETHPLDNSTAGLVARRSGMTKYEAEIALAYADYLNMIADYDPAERFAFAAPLVMVEKPILEKQSDDVALNLYAWYSKETEYDDLRTRNFVV